jgi:fucose permease
VRFGEPASGWKAQLILHAVFAVTGIAHVIGGALMPSLIATFQLSDSQAGTLFLLYFGGSAIGALLCRGSYVRLLWTGFLGMAICGCCVALASRQLLPAAFLLFGISVGMPMSAVSMYAGRNWRQRRAAILTLLNFTWSCGALLAPLLAGRVLLHHTYKSAYLVIAAAALLSSLACLLGLRESVEPLAENAAAGGRTVLGLIALFCLATFLQVGIENTSAAWLTTYAMRASGSGMVLAAYATSLYWVGFLASRGVSSFVLLRAAPARVLRVALLAALAAAVLLCAVSTPLVRMFSMFLLGASLAPVYPLLLAGFFARARHSADSRWILATAGFGGSVLPWTAGAISQHTGSLRLGMFVIPAALLLVLALLPAMRGKGETTRA